jgi:hypothetical protein
MNDGVGTAVRFQHRVATGHSVLGKPFTVVSKDPTDLDPKSSKTVKTQFRHHKPVPTELVVDDALVLVAPPSQNGSAPRISLIYHNGNSMMGADWQNAVSVEHDVPHVDAEGAQESERFWFLPGEYTPPAAPEEDEDENEDEDSSPTSTADSSSPADPADSSPAPDGATDTTGQDVATLLDQAPAAPEAPKPAQDSPEPTE